MSLRTESNEDDDHDIPPSRMLDVIANVVRSGVGKLIKSVNPDIDLFRERVGPVGYDQAGQLGPPPIEFATQSNRMSPSGIPMFYGAFDTETAKAETFNLPAQAGQIASIGTFHAVRELLLLDLADLPDIPSVFDTDGHELIHPLRFLHAFARDLAQAIVHDGHEHIEYVPTQIVTEYFRRVFQTAEGHQLDGLIYRSSKNDGEPALVLFCENEQCGGGDNDKPWFDPVLKLVAIKHEPVLHVL